MKKIKNELLPIGDESLNYIFANYSLEELGMLYPLSELQQDWNLVYGENLNLCTVPIYTLTCMLKYQQKGIARYRLIFDRDMEIFDEFFNVY